MVNSCHHYRMDGVVSSIGPQVVHIISTKNETIAVGKTSRYDVFG